MSTSNRRVAAAVAVLLTVTAVVVAVVVLRSGGSRRGAASAAVAVDQYLAALERRDPEAVRAVMAPGTTDADIGAKVAAFGGVPRGSVTVRIGEPVRPGADLVVDLGFGGRTDQVFATSRSSTWYVRLPAPTAPCDPAREVCAS